MTMSRLDYCNAIFAGVTDEQIARIQKILNNAARLILKTSKRDHVTPLLKELHWLRVKPYSIQARMLAFRRLDGTLPPHLFFVSFFSLHISTIALPSFFDRTAAQNSKDKLENFRWMFFCLHRSVCLKLAIGRPESFILPLKFQS